MEKICKSIKNKRLALNMTMDSVAQKANISRATLSAIENGDTKCSLYNLLNVCSVLGLEIKTENIKESSRNRATRINTVMNKNINEFIIMCIEEYAEEMNLSSGNVYAKMNEKGLIEDMEKDYEDLHGMSKEYLVDYIKARL